MAERSSTFYVTRISRLEDNVRLVACLDRLHSEHMLASQHIPLLLANTNKPTNPCQSRNRLRHLTRGIQTWQTIASLV